MNQTVAVVGANGFIGRNSVLDLRNHSIDVLPLGSDSADLLKQASFWEQSMVSTVVWCASRITPSVAASNPKMTECEILDFEKFLDASQGLVQKIIFASSGGTVYSSNMAPFREVDESQGVNVYGRAKKAMEEMLQNSSTPSIILRIANAYGPGQRTDRGQGVIASWIRAIAEHGAIHVFGSLNVIRDFIFIDDLVRAIRMASDYQGDSDIFNIGSGQGVTLHDVAELLKLTTDAEFEMTFDPDRGIDRPAFWLDTSHARTNLGWAPEISLSEGLKRTWNAEAKLLEARK